MGYQRTPFPISIRLAFNAGQSSHDFFGVSARAEQGFVIAKARHNENQRDTGKQNQGILVRWKQEKNNRNGFKRKQKRQNELGIPVI
jgi:hypothetical protein